MRELAAHPRWWRSRFFRTAARITALFTTGETP